MEYSQNGNALNQRWNWKDVEPVGGGGNGEGFAALFHLFREITSQRFAPLVRGYLENLW